MKTFTTIIILLLLITTVNAEEVTKYQELTINLNISSDLEIVPESNSYNVKSVEANLFLYPQPNWQQETLSFKTTPSATINDNEILFEWKYPTEKKLNYQTNSILKIKNEVFPIRSKINFPINNLDPKYSQWLESTEIINSDNEIIIKLASELVQGEDDMFQAVFNLANFTKNYINYDLQFAGEVKSAIWMINHKNGVCGDFSSLFMALTRSLGIPTKYITGVAYQEGTFTPHAWTEVYFPNIGWIPYDPTYGEYGYIDSSHIKLKESVDVNQPSVLYKWFGDGFKLNFNKIKFEGEILNKQKFTKTPFDLNINIEYPVVDVGSYQIIEANIKNLENYYISDTLHLIVPLELEFITEPKQSFVLKPGEQKTYYWIIKVSQELDQDYRYTFPIMVNSLRSETNSSFKSLPGSETLSLSLVENKLNNLKEETDKGYSSNLDITCTSPATTFINELTKIECKFSNIGTIYLETLNACIENTCRIFDLGIGKSTTEIFEIYPNKATYSPDIIIKNDIITKISHFDLKILDYPNVSITNIEVPEMVNYDEEFELRFSLTKTSLNEPKNIVIEFNNNRYPVTNFVNNKNIFIKNIGSQFSEGNNQIPLTIKYQDDKYQKFETTETVNIKLNTLTTSQKLTSTIYRIINKIAFLLHIT